MRAKAAGSLFDTYRVLRATNPSPYMFYFSSDDIELAGASPETLAKLENGTLSTFPLAGTRPRGKTREELKNVKASDALNHPTWHMGKKVTIDSSTLMNKGLEIIEAMRLYDLPLEKVTAIVHRQSIVHSMVEFTDGAVMAQLGAPDMRIPISLAMTYPERKQTPAPALDLLSCPPLTFTEIDEGNFLFSLCQNDLIYLERKSAIKFKVKNSESTLEKEIVRNKGIVYFEGGDIATAAISVTTPEDAYFSRGLGFKTLQKVQKYQVDVLGNYTLVKKEKRQNFPAQRR